MHSRTRFPFLRVRLVAAGLLLFVLGRATGTTVIEPTFDELVSKAETIFQGTVTKVESAWLGEGKERRIVTYVTFATEDVLKGNPGAAYTIRMLGGTVDGRTLRVSDAPEFTVGDRDILFIENNGRQYIPLVGIMHGRYRVAHDAEAGLDFVMSNGGAAVASVGKGHVERATAGSSGLTTDEFKAAIRAKLNNAK